MATPTHDAPSPGSSGREGDQSRLTRFFVAGRRFLILLAVKGSVWLLFLVALFYDSALFQNLREDTTAISNATFIGLATLTALTFSWAQAMRTEDPSRDTVTYSGERLMHASVLVLSASLIKYAALAVKASASSSRLLIPGIVVVTFFGFLSGTLYLFAVLDGFVGLEVVSYLLFDRTYRRPYAEYFNML